MRTRRLTSELLIESPDGASVRGRAFVPGFDEPAYPVLVLFPAMGVRASFYEPFARGLNTLGIPVVTVDLRGQGESSERASRGSRFGYRDIVEWDIPAAVASIEARFPRRAVVLGGHSLGGQLAALALARRRARAEGLFLIAAGSGHFRAWPWRSRAKVVPLVAGVGLAAKLLPWYPGRRLGFGGNQPRALMRDWTRVALTGRYPLEPPGPLSGTPVLSVQIEGDVIAPEGAAAELLRRFDSAWVVRRVLPSAGLGGAWDRHFAWAHQPAEVVEAVRAWMVTGRASRGYGFLRRELRAG